MNTKDIKELKKFMKATEKKSTKELKKMSNMTDEQKWAYQNLQVAKEDLKSAKRLFKRSKDF